MGFAGARIAEQHDVRLTGKVHEWARHRVLGPVRRNVRLAYSSGHVNQLVIAESTKLAVPAARVKDDKQRQQMRMLPCTVLGAFVKTVLPLSMPAILTVIIFTFTLTMQEFVYALTFISSSDEKPVTLGVATDLIRGDIFYWGELMGAALIASVPVAIAYNLFLDRFISGITGGAVK